MFPSSWTSVLVVISTAAPAQLYAADVRLDLSARHLGLSTLTGGKTRTFVCFDGTWQDIRLECCNTWAAFEIQPDGSMVGVNGKELLVLDPDGHLQTTFPEPAYGAQITWARESGMLASVADHADREWVFQYWRVGTRRFTIFESIAKNQNLPPPGDVFPPTTISWSRDGSAIAYSKAGKIFVYTLADRKALPVTDGTNPAWSPDGGWIAYRDPNGQASVITPQGHSAHRVGADTKILRGVRWSPDGQFVLAAVLRRDMYFDNSTQLLIIRVSDGKMIHVEPLVGGNGTEDRVFWVVKRIGIPAH